MSTLNSVKNATIERDAHGRFVPGQSGNPAGKTPGTRNRATLLRELLDEGEDRTIGRVVIDKAKAGDAVAARFVVAHLYPRPRARAVAIALADGMPAHNVVAAHDAVLHALFAGEIAPDEAEAVTRVLDARMRALKTWGQEEYLRECNRDFAAMPRPKAREVVDDKDEPKPSPPGRGQGEGVHRATDSADSSRHPHPDPLPEGEGEEKEAFPEGEGEAEAADRLHSACIEQGKEEKSPAWLELEREVSVLVQRFGLNVVRPPAAP